MSLERSKHSYHNQFYASLSSAERQVQVHYIYYCQSKATEQKSVSTPNAFKHYQFQEKQAQLLHENLNYAFLCCFPLCICHSPSRNHEERSAMVKIFQFSHQNIRKQDKKQASLFQTLPTVLSCHFTAMSVYSCSHEDSSALDIFELTKKELKQNSCLFLW